MLTIHPHLKAQIQELNTKLVDGYAGLRRFGRQGIREKIDGSLGVLKKLQPLEETFLKGQGQVVGVDGSNLRLGGNPPHYIECFQALAKGSRQGEGLFVSEVFTPLLSAEEERPDSRLARLELQAALEAAKAWKPWVILMDGGLLRYQIDAEDHYQALSQYCTEMGIILVGVIKDIKTTLVETVLPSPPGIQLHDKEALFGVLDYGEILLIHDAINHKYKQGLSSAFMRSSQAPTAIGLDTPAAQKGSLEEVARLILNLTPIQSRGIPLWLDIVDREARLGYRATEALLKASLDPAIYRTLVESERSQRPR